MSGALAVPLALAGGTLDKISGAALGAALLVLFALFALALARWNDDEDDEAAWSSRDERRPGYVEIRPVPARDDPPKRVENKRCRERGENYGPR